MPEILGQAAHNRPTYAVSRAASSGRKPENAAGLVSLRRARASSPPKLHLHSEDDSTRQSEQPARHRKTARTDLQQRAAL